MLEVCVFMLTGGKHLVSIGVGEPLQLTYYDEDHPYFFPEDIFDNLDTSLALISKVRSMHNCG